MNATHPFKRSPHGRRNWWLAANSSDPHLFEHRHVDVPTAPHGHRLCDRDAYVGGTATIPTALTPRQQIIIDLLSEGPRTTRELAVACGYGENDRGGRSYVSVALGRLSIRGYGFHNYNPIGSHRGACYVLMTRPRGASAVANGGICSVCHSRLNRWNDDGVCWPCQRSRLDVELDMLAPPTLFPVSVAS